MSTMSTDETYNGWSNRETWAFNLHWQNDQGLYNETLEVARRYIEETYGQADHLIHDAGERKAAYYGAAEHVIAYWRDLLADEDYAPFGSGLRAFEREVGSWWRVNAHEVADTLAESLSNEGL